LAFEPFKRYQKCLQKVLQQMIGKNGIDIWKNADNNPVEPYTERKSISTEHLWTGHYRHSKKLKSILVGMVENWPVAF
jgi:DNA polymerase-4